MLYVCTLSGWSLQSSSVNFDLFVAADDHKSFFDDLRHLYSASITRRFH